jgi:UDP-GlcNAc:undecaprenyl-phosphate GlcNAc-1-phosphate transferase
VSAALTLAALPVSALVLWGLLRSTFRDRLVAVPSDERWHERPTPTFGGVGIFAGLVAGVGLAASAVAVADRNELLGIMGGCTILFAAGLIDDLRPIQPLAKLAAQFAAAGVAIASGLQVELIANDLVATVVALVWLVGITNAFNLLDNMDGLAATLATVACACFAIDAATAHPNRLVLVVSLALGFACLGFLPFNLRPGRSAIVFMGDSGSQVIGFALASLGLAASWTVAGGTVATVILPLLVLAIPIVDTTLVTVMRLFERRPVTQGGKDHTSHRLVYYGLSEQRAVALLATLAIAIGATSLAYNALNDARVTVAGVLVTVVLLVQFASFLTELEEGVRRGDTTRPSLVRALLDPRRLAEILVDFALICVSFLVSYVLVLGDLGSPYQRAVFLSALPVLLLARYASFVVAGVYRRVWRFAGSRDAIAIAAACVVSGLITLVIVEQTRSLRDFGVSVFVVDALLCTVLVGGSRLVVQVVLRHRAERTATTSRRVLIVGAGKSGRSLARELRETPGMRPVGFVDDNSGVRRRRIGGVTVIGGLDEMAGAIASTAPDEVMVTIPNAPAERLVHVSEACESAGVAYTVLRRQSDIGTPSLLGLPAK